MFFYIYKAYKNKIKMTFKNKKNLPKKHSKILAESVQIETTDVTRPTYKNYIVYILTLI